jgi:hypothetical protein
VGNILRERPAKESRRADSSHSPAHYECAVHSPKVRSCADASLLFMLSTNITLRMPSSVSKTPNLSLGKLVDGEQGEDG